MLVGVGIGVLVGVGTGTLVGVGSAVLVGVGTGVLVGVGTGMLVGVGAAALAEAGTAVFAGVGDPSSPKRSATSPRRFAASSLNPVSPQATFERAKTTRIKVIKRTRENAKNTAT